jgi:hypothetical protein
MRLTDRANDLEGILLPPTNLTGTDVLAANLTTPADKLLLALCVWGGTMTPEAVEWLAPHQAHRGGVTNLASNYSHSYSHGGQSLTRYLANTLDKLITNGLIAPGTPNSIRHHRIRATHTAQPRYSALDTTNTPSQNDIGAR